METVCLAFALRFCRVVVVVDVRAFGMFVGCCFIYEANSFDYIFMCALFCCCCCCYFGWFVCVCVCIQNDFRWLIVQSYDSAKRKIHMRQTNNDIRKLPAEYNGNEINSFAFAIDFPYNNQV